MSLMVLWALASFGLAFVLGHSKISLPLRILIGGQPERTRVPELGFPISSDRNLVVRVGDGPNTEVGPAVPPLVPVAGPFFVALLECPGCLGFWQGAFGALLWPALVVPFGLPVWAGVLALALATSATNLLLARYVGIV